MKFGNLVNICLWTHLAVKGLIQMENCYSWATNFVGAVDSNENNEAHTSVCSLPGRCLNVLFSKNLHTLGNAMRL